MSTQHIIVELEMPLELGQFKLPPGVNERLQNLLDPQDSGEILAEGECEEAQGLVELSEMLSLLRARAQRIQNKEIHHGGHREHRED